MGNFKNELHGYKIIPCELVFDKTLSDRARFVFVFMACKPADWDFFLEPMAKDIGYSVDTLRKYINELVASGWLVKGEQQKNNGLFSAVEYTLKATNSSDTENFRHGKTTIQHNIDNIQNIDCIREKNDKDKSLSKKDELFEKCWLAYKRKGSKKKAKEYWGKLTDDEKKFVLPHIQSYVSSRDLQYQKDFERYLRDKIFLTIVYQGNRILFDPAKEGADSQYIPQTGFDLNWDEINNCFMYVGYWNGFIPDGYSDENRPDGATVMLNNGRGLVKWNSKTKTWNKQ